MTVISAPFYVLPRISFLLMDFQNNSFYTQNNSSTRIATYLGGEILPCLSPSFLCRKKIVLKLSSKIFSPVLTETAQEQDEQGASQCNLATKLNLTQCQKITESPGHAQWAKIRKRMQFRAKMSRSGHFTLEKCPDRDIRDIFLV